MAATTPFRYTIEPGDTAFALAERFLGDGDRWREFTHVDGRPFTVAEAEDLRPGQVVLIPGEAPGLSDTDDAGQLLAITNRLRAGAGLPPLALDPRLNASARAHAELMAGEDALEHRLPNEPELGDRIRARGYAWSAVGENIAAGQSSPEDAMSSWFDETPPDDGHRRNLLSPDFRHMGAGHVFREGTRFGHYWAVDFGEPA